MFNDEKIAEIQTGWEEFHEQIMALPAKEFALLKADADRRAARKNADMGWMWRSRAFEKASWLRCGRTLEEYHQMLKARIESRRLAREERKLVI